MNIWNIDDNECFKWCLVWYLNPADHYPERIKKANKVNYPIYVSKKCCEDKHVHLLLIGEEDKKHYVPIK